MESTLENLLEWLIEIFTDATRKLEGSNFSIYGKYRNITWIPTKSTNSAIFFVQQFPFSNMEVI